MGASGYAPARGGIHSGMFKLALRAGVPALMLSVGELEEDRREITSTCSQSLVEFGFSRLRPISRRRKFPVCSEYQRSV
ncbi:Uncharacterised protein [uncultured archaeon]|nr:Uncharacterised protein [uncultured archaeon]